MIDYIDIKNLGFKKLSFDDSVYENQFGRPYWFMEFKAEIVCKEYTNQITINWDCDSRNVDIFVNYQKTHTFTDYNEFINFFSIFK